jgi:hypothetical protein
MSTRPHCQQCQKELRPVSTEAGMKKSIERQTRIGYTVAAIEMSREYYRRTLGTYGYGGHGLFCSLRCGYYYALDKLR